MTAPLVSSRRWGIRIALVLFFAVVAPMGVTLVRLYPPAHYSFYPPCLLYRMTGWHCPGCGATRAVGALADGDLPQALAYNALFVLAVPILAYVGVRIVYELWTGRKAPGGVHVPDWVFKGMIVVMIAYAILRNLPFEPFTFLAPHAL